MKTINNKVVLIITLGNHTLEITRGDWLKIKYVTKDNPELFESVLKSILVSKYQHLAAQIQLATLVYPHYKKQKEVKKTPNTIKQKAQKLVNQFFPHYKISVV